MEQQIWWDSLLENNQSPCYIMSKDDNVFRYINPKFKEAFQKGNEVLGKTLFDVVSPKDVQMDDPLPDWNKVTTYETRCFNQKVNLAFTMRSVLLPDGEHTFTELCTYEKSHSSSILFEEAMGRCMDIFTQSTEHTSYELMKYLSEFYQSFSAFVYRYNEETEVLYCVVRWCEDPQRIVKEEIAIPFNGASLMKSLREESRAGILVADTQAEGFDPNSVMGLVMQTIHVSNMTLCAIEDSERNVVGMVGLANRKNMEIPLERRLITAVSRFVSQDVSKGIVNQTLFDLHHRDPLTGLYNRSGFARRIDGMLSEKPKTMGCISANINGLKFVNENAGISGGDAHIKNAVKRMRDHFPFDIFRMSGDEFIGFYPNVSEEEFENLVNRLHLDMKAEENFDFSLGHSWDKGSIDTNKLQMEADTVMYINKQNYYATNPVSFDNFKDTTLADLLSYLENEEFMVYLQPQVRLVDGSLHGAEALIRRFDKVNQKMVFPDQFISLYEKKSVIRHVDMFVVEEVCKLLQVWQKEGKAIPVSVNLSRVTLLEFGIVEHIAEICDRYKVDRQFLVIEVTERVGLIENNVASSLILDFIRHGFKISLDDFGCAYSNIVTLAQIDVDEVKLDKSLVDNLTISLKNKVLVKNVLNMCNELENTSTLAEGIEDKDQSQLLYDLGCELGQGYYYSRPVPVPDFVDKYKEYLVKSD